VKKVEEVKSEKQLMFSNHGSWQDFGGNMIAAESFLYTAQVKGGKMRFPGPWAALRAKANPFGTSLLHSYCHTFMQSYTPPTPFIQIHWLSEDEPFPLVYHEAGGRLYQRLAPGFAVRFFHYCRRPVGEAGLGVAHSLLAEPWGDARTMALVGWVGLGWVVGRLFWLVGRLVGSGSCLFQQTAAQTPSSLTSNGANRSQVQRLRAEYLERDKERVANNERLLAKHRALDEEKRKKREQEEEEQRRAAAAAALPPAQPPSPRLPGGLDSPKRAGGGSGAAAAAGVTPRTAAANISVAVGVGSDGVRRAYDWPMADGDGLE
jgi:hypothetical protein